MSILGSNESCKEFKKQTRLEASGGKKDVRPCICLYIDSIFTWIVTRPCAQPMANSNPCLVQLPRPYSFKKIS
jgi:hypothetical protein